jgi:hypothetical protein
MATAFEMPPDQAGTLTPPRVIHVLLAQTEQRLVATLERYGEDLTAARAELAAVLAMLDRSGSRISATRQKCLRTPATGPTRAANIASRPGAGPWRAT